MDIGHKIKQLRIQNGLTLEELASRSELTKGFLSQLERNLTSPSISTLEDILEALGSSLSDFFKEEKDEKIRIPEKRLFRGREGRMHHKLDSSQYTEKRYGANTHRDTTGRKIIQR